jgi:hypothetical protein
VVPVKLFTSLAERKRQLVREKLSEVVLLLFARQGFEETTVDQIAAAGVSTGGSSLLSRSRKTSSSIPSNRSASNSAPSWPPRRRAAAGRHVPGPLPAHRSAPGTSGEITQADPAAAAHPTVRARYLDYQARWHDGFAAVLATRAGLEPTDIAPR